MSLDEFLQGVKERWNQLIAVAVIIVTALSGFVLAPPAAEVQTSHLDFGRFVVAGAVGLWILPMMRWRLRRHAWRWWGAGIALLVSCVAVVLLYQGLRSRSTFPYFGERRLKGDHLQPVAQAFADSAREAGTILSDSALVYEAAGSIDQVWPASELEQTERRLLLGYLAALLVGASTIIVITQALFCSGARSSPGKPGKKIVTRSRWLVLGLLLSPVSGAVAQDPAISTAEEFRESSRAELIAGFGLEPVPASTELGRLLLAEMQRLNQESEMRTEIWLSRSSDIISHPDFGIAVNERQLDSLRRRSSVSHFTELVRLLLAHEQAHQIQYRTYGRDLDKLPAPERRMLEAQADVIAGHYLVQTIVTPERPSQTEAIAEALRVASDLGAEPFALATHPPAISRLSAVRLGMASGMAEKWQELGGPGLANARHLRRVLDWPMDTSFLDWSRRLGRRVTAHAAPAVFDLIAERGEDTIAWNKDGNPPIVEYDLVYSNAGPRVLMVDLEVQSASVPRTERDDIFRWQKIDAAQHRFRLAPGERYHVRGTLNWNASAELMPLLVSPPSPAGLLTVAYAGTPAASAPVEIGSSGLPAAPGEPTERAVAILRALVQGVRAGGQSLRNGPGARFVDVVEYPAGLALPGSVWTKVLLPDSADEQPSVEVQLYAGSDSGRALESYQRVRDLVVEALADWTQRPELTTERVRRVTLVAPETDVEATIRLGRNNSGRYRVVLALERQP